MTEWIIGLVIAGGLGAAAGVLFQRMMDARRRKATAESADRMLAEARREAENTRKEASLAAKAELIRLREEFEQSTKSRRDEMTALETRINQRETNLDRKVALLDKKERTLDDKIADLDERRSALEKSASEVEQRSQALQTALERVAQMTREEARDEIMSTIDKALQSETGALIRRYQDQARDSAEREAQKIVTMAVQRYAGSHASEIMTSSVALPNEEMKGRIIGREGRNIRAIEALTGVNLLIDDTPEAVVISSFDPVRREIARLALERLVMDGRIHPARVEEVVAKTTEEMEQTIRQAGEEAAYLTGVPEVDPELLSMLGKLKYRTSYTQNVLMHSMEVAHLMGMLASQIGLDVSLAKRIGLFHDIGKAMDHEVEGQHPKIGADYLRQHGEQPMVVNAVASHHNSMQPDNVYAVLVVTADAISASRPGARTETTEIYIKRLEKLEQIAQSFDGVQKTFAIYAGRELRVLVDADKIDDNHALALARNITKKIEAELQYPGIIRVTVIRETRCIEYAR